MFKQLVRPHSLVAALVLALLATGVTPLFAQAAAEQAAGRTTFLVTSNLDFGKSTVSSTDHARHAATLRGFALSGIHWPAGAGLPNEPIAAPSAILTTGNNFQHGTQDELNAFGRLWGPGGEGEPAIYPGLGGTDLAGGCQGSTCARSVLDSLGTRLSGSIAHFDQASGSYSWDLGGVHFIQFNNWGGGAQFGSGAAATTHPIGLDWLEQDLKTSLANTNRPVVLLQHLGSASRGWTATDRAAVWNLISRYNVVALFSGDGSQGVSDWNEFGGHLDNFTAGAGGEDACLAAGHSACGGRGQFYAVRVSDRFLDVASLGWRSNPDGSARTPQPEFTALNPDSAASALNPSATQSGCRKLISSRVVDVSDLVNHGELDGAAKSILVTNTSSIAIPGPLALEFTGVGNTASDLENKAFVDRCSPGADSFLVPGNGSAAGLAPGASLSFSPLFAGSSNASAGEARLVRYAQARGADPAAVKLVRTAKGLPADGVITVYGPPNTPFTLSTTITGTPHWVAATARAAAFDRFGQATVDYKLNGDALNGSIHSTESAEVKVIAASGERDEVVVPIELSSLASDSINNIKLSPGSQVSIGQKLAVTAHLQYVPVADTTDGGTYRATGTMQLVDITNSSAPVTLESDTINSSCDPGSDPNCPSQPNDTANFPALTLAPGIHTLEVTYSGDSIYASATSASFTALVGNSVLQLNTVPSGLAVDFDGRPETSPYETTLKLNSSHVLEAPALQTRPGVKYLFDHWNPNGSTQQILTFTATQPTEIISAVYNSEYLLTLNPSPAVGGTVTATPASSTGYYPAGSHVTVTATAAAGYAFTGFSGALSGTVNGQTVTINSPATVTANFAPLYLLTLNASPAAGGKVTATPASSKGYYAAGSTVTITATAASRYIFTGFSGALSGATNGQTVTINGPTTVTANFAPAYRLTLNASPTAGGTVTATPPSSTGYYAAGTTVTITATPASGYIFTGFSGALSGATNGQTVTINGATTVTAKFVPLYLLTLNASPANEGSVTASPASSSGYYAAGTKVTITATAASGDFFTGFSGGLSGTANGRTVTIYSPTTVTANFVPITKPVITWPAPNPILVGTALSSTQLNATTTVPGKFVYSPLAGTKPPVGNGYKLSTTFTPVSGEYSTATASTTINVLPVLTTHLGITTSATRIFFPYQINLTLTVTNVSNAPIANIQLTKATLGTSAPVSPLPVTVSIAANSATNINLAYAGTVGAPGSSKTLTLSGTVGTAAFNYTTTITLP